MEQGQKPSGGEAVRAVDAEERAHRLREFDAAGITPPEQFESPIFGPTRHPTEGERTAIAQACSATPVAVFQELNKVIRARGFLIIIGAPGEQS